jgi:hypothetical protein
MISDREAIHIFIGLLISSFLSTIAIFVLITTNYKISLQSLFSAFVLLYGIYLIVATLFGFPAFLLLRRFRPGRWWSVLPVGFFLGMLAGATLGWPGRPYPKGLLAAGLLGALTTFIFWRIWRRGATDPESGSR